MDTNSACPPSMDAPRRPRGRPPSRSWAFFTTIVEPQKQPSAVCRHCNQLVYHRQKWGQARTHLMKCPQFVRFMETMPANEMPEWYLAEISRRQHLLSRSKAAAVYSYPVVSNQLRTQSVSSFKPVQPIPLTMMPNTMENVNHMALENGAQVELATVEEKVAMHLFTTMSMEQLMTGKMELPFLLQAVRACNRGFVLPNKGKLMTELLGRCFESVNGRVKEFLTSSSVPVTLSLTTATVGSKKDWVVCYMASLATSDKYPMYLESVKGPSSEEERADVEWIVRDVARVVEKMSCPVAGCVLLCSSPERQRTRDLLEEHFPAMYFHGCMRDALWSLVRDVFTAGGATDTDRSISVPFVEDLQQFALQCKDLEFFLPIQKDKSYLDEVIESSTIVMHVTVQRRLTVNEAFSAILRAEPFLDPDSVLNQLFPSGLNEDSPAGSSHPANQVEPPGNIAHLQSQLVTILHSPEFEKKLRKYLEVLRPICRLLELVGGGTNATSLLLSDVDSSFSGLAQQYASSGLLLPEEKEVLQELIRQCQENMLGSTHLLANLLDPVLLGENLPVDKMANVEQKLMSSLHVDGTCLSDTEKAALCAQYKDFRKSALTQKAETLVFRTLNERQRSPLQFWFNDGARWPMLQGIACRIFVMPVCATVISEAGVALHPFREKTDFLVSDKLVYVRINTHQLNLAEVAGSSLVTVVQKPPSERIADNITASMVV